MKKSAVDIFVADVCSLENKGSNNVKKIRELTLKIYGLGLRVCCAVGSFVVLFRLVIVCVIFRGGVLTSASVCEHLSSSLYVKKTLIYFFDLKEYIYFVC